MCVTNVAAMLDDATGIAGLVQLGHLVIQLSRARRAMRVEFQLQREPDRGHAKLF